MTAPHTVLNDLRAVVGPERLGDARPELIDMCRDARLMMAVYYGIGFDTLQSEFCGYSPDVLWVFYSHHKGLR